MKKNIFYFASGALCVICTIILSNILRIHPVQIPLHTETEVKTAALMVEDPNNIKFEERKPLPVSSIERKELKKITGIEIEDQDMGSNVLILKQTRIKDCTFQVTYIVTQKPIETHKSYLLEFNLDWPFVKLVAIRTAIFDWSSKVVVAEVQYQEIEGRYGKGCVPVFPISLVVEK